MSVTLREYRESDREAFGLVRSYTFRGAEPIAPTENLLRPDSLAYVADSDDGIVGAFTVLQQQVHYWGQLVPCAGIAAVAVHPEYRGMGVGSAMMRQALPLLRERGFVFASLYAFREPYYRRFGYEVTGTRYEIKVPEHRLPQFKGELPPRLIKGDVISQIEPCFDAFAARYNGTLKRGPDAWWRMLGGETPFTVYAFGDPIEAYMMVRLSGYFWQQQPLKELIWTSPAGYRSALAFLSGLAINKSEIAWIEPGDSPILRTYLDQGIELRLEKPLMVRVLDAKRALEAIPTTDAAPTLVVDDPDIAENRGPWVCGNGETVQVSINQLAQICYGEPGWESLVRHGEVKTTASPYAIPSHRSYGADPF